MVKENVETKKKATLNPFKTVTFGNNTFSGIRQTYGMERAATTVKMGINMSSSIHEKPFKCSNPPKLGYNCTLNKITYKEEGEPKQLIAKKIETPWKESGAVDTMGYTTVVGNKSEFRYLL